MTSSFVLAQIPKVADVGATGGIARHEVEGETYIVRVLRQAPHPSHGEAWDSPFDDFFCPGEALTSRAAASILQACPRRSPTLALRDALIRLGRLQGAIGHAGGWAGPVLEETLVPFGPGALVVTEMGMPVVPVTDVYICVGRDYLAPPVPQGRDSEICALWSGLLARPKTVKIQLPFWHSVERKPHENEI